jgi:hypothetical protein
VTGFTQPPSIAPQNAVNHQAKLNEIMGKYTGSGVARHTSTNAITIQDLVRKMHQGSGFDIIIINNSE